MAWFLEIQVGEIVYIYIFCIDQTCWLNVSIGDLALWEVLRLEDSSTKTLTNQSTSWFLSKKNCPLSTWSSFPLGEVVHSSFLPTETNNKKQLSTTNGKKRPMEELPISCFYSQLPTETNPKKKHTRRRIWDTLRRIFWSRPTKTSWS